jgi:hypothetical protein
VIARQRKIFSFESHDLRRTIHAMFAHRQREKLISADIFTNYFECVNSVKAFGYQVVAKIENWIARLTTPRYRFIDLSSRVQMKS